MPTTRAAAIARLITIAAACALAPASLAQTEYAYDDGVANISFGPPRSFEQYGDIDMLWGNYFATQQPQEFVTSIAFGLGRLSGGSDGEVSIWIFNDPDDDFDPTNAVPIFSTTVTGYNLGFGFNVLEIEPVAVGGGFFVAIGHLAELSYDAGGHASYPTPARFDPDGRADRSWFFYDSAIPAEDLGSSGFVQRMDGPFVPIGGAFAIRATTIPTPGGMGLGAVLLAVLGPSAGRGRRRCRERRCTRGCARGRMPTG